MTVIEQMVMAKTRFIFQRKSTVKAIFQPIGILKVGSVEIAYLLFSIEFEIAYKTYSFQFPLGQKLIAGT